MNPRLGLITLFSGDKRRVSVTIANVTSFSAVSGALKQGDSDLTSTYVSGSAVTAGNIIWSGIIGNTAIPSGSYRYYVSGTYGGITRTWFWDVLVLPKEVTYLSEIPLTDYNPYLGEVTLYDSDNIVKTVTLPLEPSAASGVLKFLGEDVTSTYCNSSPSVSGNTITTHNIGSTTLPPGEYGYFVSGTFNNSEAIVTWYWKLNVLPKASAI
jgi:hypothetical protein